MKMNEFTLPTPGPGEQLWGIYYTNRKYARMKGDPLLGVVAAETKDAAEKTALRQGLPDAWANPLTAKQIESMRMAESQSSEKPHVTIPPTTAELRTAIEVLKLLDQRLNDHAAHSTGQLPPTDLGDRYAEQIEARTIEQTSHIEKVSAELQNWRNELLQQQQRQMAHSV